MGGLGRVGGGSQGGCERKIEVFVKIQKKNWGLGGGGGRVGVFFFFFFFFLGGGGGGSGCM